MCVVDWIKFSDIPPFSALFSSNVLGKKCTLDNSTIGALGLARHFSANKLQVIGPLFFVFLIFCYFLSACCKCLQEYSFNTRSHARVGYLFVYSANLPKPLIVFDLLSGLILPSYP